MGLLSEESEAAITKPEAEEMLRWCESRIEYEPIRWLLSRYKSQQEQIAELKTQLQTLRDRYDLDDNNLPMNGN